MQIPTAAGPPTAAHMPTAVRMPTAAVVAAHQTALCPAGAGAQFAEAVQNRTPWWYQNGLTFEDEQHSRAECRLEASRNHHRTIAANTECVLIPSQRTYVSLVWKTGTRTVIDYLQCAFKDASYITLTSPPVERARCGSVPTGWKLIGTIRDPFDRFFSAYGEFVERAQSRPPGRPGSVPTEDVAAFSHKGKLPSTFVRFVREARCRHDGAWAHASTQVCV